MSKTPESKSEQHLIVVLKGGGFVFAGVIISKFISYVSRLIVARLGPEYYGLLSITLVIFSFASFLALLGFSDCIVRYVSYFYNKKDFQRLKGSILFPLKFTFILGLLAGFCLFVLSDWISLTFFHDIRLSILLKLFAFVIPFDVLRANFVSIMVAFKKAKAMIYSKNIAENISKVIILAILILLGYGLFGATLAYGLAIFISFLVSFLYFRKLEIYKLIISNIKPIYKKRDMLFYSLPLLFSSAIFFFISWTDTFMLGYFKDAYQVGVYNAAYPTAMLLWVVPHALLFLALPIMAEIYASNDKKNTLEYLIKKIMKWILLLNIIPLLIFSFFADNLLSVLFGSQYAEGSCALIILSLAFFIWALFETFEKLLLTLKKTKIILFNAIITAVFNILLNYLLIPKYGILGAAIATGTSLVLLSILRIIEVYLFTKMLPFDVSLWKLFCAGIISLVIVKLLISYLGTFNIIILIFILCLSVMLYAFLLLLFQVIDIGEFNMFLKFQKRLGINLGILNNILLKFVKK